MYVDDDLEDEAAEIGLAMSWLCVNHQLRSLSLALNAFSTAAPLVVILNALSLTEFDPTQPDYSIPCQLTALSIQVLWGGSTMPTRLPDTGRLHHLPNLTRLHWTQQLHPLRYKVPDLKPVFDPALPSARLCLSRLQHLQLTIESKQQESALAQLSVCTQLRVLHLSTESSELSVKTIPACLLQQLLTAWAPTIEEIRLTALKISYLKAVSDSSAAGYDGEWKSLAACHQLRLLELPLQPKMPAGLVSALGSLPRFHALELSWSSFDPSNLQLPSNLLSCMVASRARTWSHLYLCALAGPAGVQSLQHAIRPGSGLSMSLDLQLVALRGKLALEQAACKRIRVHYHCDRQLPSQKETCYCISKNQEGQHVWLQQEQTWQRAST